MCTVTVVARASTNESGPRVRLMCNRDEQRTRARSTSLVRRTLDTCDVVMPVDPESGGTWIGASAAGVAVCLLNANPGSNAPAEGAWADRRSRGEIVPRLIEAGTLEEARRASIELNARAYPPFHVLLLDELEYVIGRSDGESLVWTRTARLEGPLMLTSSGLGDDRVEKVRRDLFETAILEADDPWEAQTRFHSHAWPERRELSVLMSRKDARTVSRTTLGLVAGRIEFAHEWLGDAMQVEATSREILRIETPCVNACGRGMRNTR